MEILEDVDLRGWTTFRIGGKARYLFKPRTVEEVKKSLEMIRAEGLNFFVLGEGSNVVLGSGDYRGGVISLLGLRWIKEEEGVVRVGAGVLNSELALWGYWRGYEGYEFLYRMPGSIGGSLLMNARCFGRSMSDVTLEAKAMDLKGNIEVYESVELGFGYKKSLFSGGGYIIVEGGFEKKEGMREEVKFKMEANKRHRLESHQNEYPSAGCIFKNNRGFGESTGRIIDNLGLKGLREGSAEVYEEHGNFIVNKGGADSKDVVKLIEDIQRIVKEKEGFELECEVKFHGEFE